jgi:two-component system, NarL family, response regulator NreC
MGKMTTVVLAEDHNLVREGLKSLVERDPTLKVVGEATDGRQAVELVERLKPTLLLLDLMLPRVQGLDALRQVKKARETKVVVVSMYSDEARVLEAFRNGAAGYVLKDATASELLGAIRTVLAGQCYLSPSLSQLALNASLKKTATGETDIFYTLSARERLVLQLGAEGNTNAAIGKQLYISPRTVETHRANLMKKLSLRSQTDLVRFAIRKNLISP